MRSTPSNDRDDTPCSVDTFNPPHCLPSVVLCDLRGLCVKGRAWESVAVGVWLRLRRSGFSVILISQPMNCQSGSWVHGAKEFGDVFVGSFVELSVFGLELCEQAVSERIVSLL